jgi:hypothetical protein
MAKRKITVTVDQELVDSVQTIGTESLSAVINTALAQEVDRRARAAALSRLLAEWDSKFGAVAAGDAAAAVTAFDDVDAVATEDETAPRRRSGRGAP